MFLLLRYTVSILIGLSFFSASLEAKPPNKQKIEREFLKENALKPGITTTRSGLQYELLKKGEGTENPKWRYTISIHFQGTLIDGTVFESTLNRKQPVSMQLTGLIDGWTEGIKLMNVGDKYRFYIPSDLGYGSKKQGVIPPYSVLIFEIELFSIKGRK